MKYRTIGRDAITGRFISIDTALCRPSTSVVETMEVPSRTARLRRRRTVPVNRRKR